MHELNLKTIKGSLIIIVTAVIFVMVGGITILRGNYYLRSKFVVLEWDFIKTEVAYANQNYGGVVSWMFRKDVPNQESGKAKSIPILLYHGVIEDPNWKPDNVNISLSDFRSQMFALKKAGYQTVTLSQFLSFVRGNTELPEKSIMITFDDARKDSFYPVDPVLRTLDYNAVMFVITGRSIGSGNEKNTYFHLSEQELSKMLDSGRWEVGSHTQNGHDTEKIDASGTMGHFLSDRIWLESEGRIETVAEYRKRISDDLLGSKIDLEKNLGIDVLGFAYPFGDYGQNTQNFSDSKKTLNEETSVIFPISFRQTGNYEFPQDYPGKNLYLAKRINMDSSMTQERLLAVLDGGREKSIPYEDSFGSDNGWLVGWGSSELKKGLFLTGASDSEDSSLSFLNGTYSWTDYTVSANVQILKGNSFALVARYIDGNSYVSCDFSPQGVALSGRVNGNETEISESLSISGVEVGKDIPVGISVAGNQASCYIGDKIVTSGIISEKLSHGGIGFKTWDNNVNNSSVLVSTVKVN
jgi:peptidoglycan/xylan/chitin deacetylase (PgdA/CDA1 family)